MQLQEMLHLRERLEWSKMRINVEHVCARLETRLALQPHAFD
jgi:hypothetical protein